MKLDKMKFPTTLFLLAFLTALTIIAALIPSTIAQEQQLNSRCPVITLDCPINCPKADQDSLFRANIEGGESKTAHKYHWSVLNGKIIGGQGTDVLSVRFNNLCETMMVTVNIDGLAPGCTYSSSCTTVNHCCWGLARKFDEFGNICCADEKSRLGNFGIQLLNDPEAQGYIIYYEGRRYPSCYNPRPRFPRRGEAEVRVARMKPYLVNVVNIDQKRIVVINGGYRDEWTAELWIVTKGGSPPTPTPTLEATNIKYRKGKATESEYDKECIE